MDNFAIMSSMISKMFGLNTLFVDDKNEIVSRLYDMYEDEDDGSVIFSKMIANRLSKVKKDVIYEYRSRAGVSLILFNWCEKYAVTTPFFNKKWGISDFEKENLQNNDEEAEIDVSVFKSLMNFPRLNGDELIRFIKSVIETLTPTNSEYKYTLNESEKPKDESDVGAFKPIEYKYINEREFMNAVEAGDFRRATDILYLMHTFSQEQNIPYLREKDVDTSSAILRTLCRISAYSAGVTPAVIESISEKYNVNFSNMKKYLSLEVIKEQTILMIEEYCYAVNKAKNNNYSPIVKYIVDFIELNFAKSISLDDVAKQCGISKNYLPHAFKRETGKTVVEYISDYRLDKAAELLRCTSLSIQEVGGRVGYLDNNYFSKIFKKRFGETPSIYRKKNHNNSKILR